MTHILYPDDEFSASAAPCAPSALYFLNVLQYFFDEEGYMKTGWIHWNEKDYFCDESGAMLVNTVTPDGASVGADGAKL